MEQHSAVCSLETKNRTRICPIESLLRCKKTICYSVRLMNPRLLEVLKKTYLHDEEVGVVNVESYRAEQILYPGVVGIHPVDQVLVPTTYHHLGSETDTEE